MSDFEQAIDVVLEREKGFSNDKKDRGGPTNFGISLRFLKGLGKAGDLNVDGIIDINDIKFLNADLAEDLYNKNFWLEYGYDQIKDQSVATKILDIAVNCGPGTAASIVQRAVNFWHTPPGELLVVDGNLGPKSIKAINKCKPKELLESISIFQKIYYQKVLKKFPDQEKWINGWIKRADKI